ncbi:MAG: flavin reductase family protein [Geodermatophilaceae bacterium]|nr:flavin reductase family protein [Geodermatophilaceae bacterium]MDQ3464497.1 flavin reductase family protein [Actinomycetota bacterium]
MTAVSVEQYKAALGRFASGVTVLSVRDELDDHGITVTAFASVSLDPPLVLASVARASYLHEVLLRRDLWAVSVLAAGQRSIATRFSEIGRPSARLLLADLPHRRGPSTDALIIEDGMAALECRTEQRVDAGDHTLLIGRVLDVAYVADRGAPLLHVTGAYTTSATTPKAASRTSTGDPWLD